MTKKLEIYKCGVCGNIIEVLYSGGGELVCCGQPMEVLKEHTQEELKEKHLPVASRESGDLNVKVGSVAHPMEEKHFIEWIQVIAGEQVIRKFLYPGAEPSAVFKTPEGSLTLREYCNIHGLWRSEDA